MCAQPVGSTFVQLCVDDSLNTVAEGCRVILEGPLGDSTLYEDAPSATPNTLIKISDARLIDGLFGEGSVLAESLKVAMDCCRSPAIEFYALPRPDYGTNAVYTLTFSAEDVIGRGTIDIYVGEGRYQTRVSVPEGASVADVVTLVGAALFSIPGLPFVVATVPPGEGETLTALTLTARNGGSYGNNISILIQWHGRDSALPENLEWTIAQTTAGAGSQTLFTDYESLVGSCCGCCWAVLSDDANWQSGANSYLESTWDCSKPMCMTIGYTYNSGTVGQILAEDTNSRFLTRLAHCNPTPSDPTVGDAIMPWLKVASYATISCCDTVANPELSIEGPDYGLLRCLQGPMTCFDCFSYADKVELSNSGFVTTSDAQSGSGQLTRPYINSDITNNRYDENGRENLTYQDVVSLRLMKKTAQELSDELRQYQGLALFTRNTSVRSGTKGTSPKILLGKLRAWAKTNIGVLFSEFEDLDAQLTVRTDEEVQPACYGDPRRLLVNLVYTPPLRIKDIQVGMSPKFRQSCDA